MYSDIVGDFTLSASFGLKASKIEDFIDVLGVTCLSWILEKFSIG